MSLEHIFCEWVLASGEQASGRKAKVCEEVLWMSLEYVHLMWMSMDECCAILWFQKRLLKNVCRRSIVSKVLLQHNSYHFHLSSRQPNILLLLRAVTNIYHIQHRVIIFPHPYKCVNMKNLTIYIYITSYLWTDFQ
jgi:hypothetical protein